MLLVKKGVRLSVGDGNKISLKSDYWIPNMRPEVLLFRAPIPDEAMVAFLL
jgi:hypothetical protein